MNYVSIEAQKELEAIRVKNGGFLRPQDVVKNARRAASALHNYFEWSNTVAAEKYRLIQAQKVIRISVVVSEDTNEKVRAFVSLSSDRDQGRGYRAVVDVLDDSDLLQIYLEDAKTDLLRFSQKYDSLKELAELRGVFEEIKKLSSPKKNKQKEIRAAA